MVLRASIINDGDTRDVVCDADGRLLVGGISLSGSVAIDLTDTNAALNQLIDILDPATGNFTVQVDPAFPVVVDTTNPIDVNIAGIDAIFSGQGIPVRIQSADSNIDVHVVVDAISNTAFPNGIPVKIDGIDLTDFPNGLPINFSGISAAFPNGIPIKVSGLDALAFPNGIPINVTAQTTPLNVKIDTTGGPSVVNLNTSQFNDLINAIGDDNNQVFIKDADGLLSNSNPLRTVGSLLDSTGAAITTTNRLPVDIGANATIDFTNSLTPINEVIGYTNSTLSTSVLRTMAYGGSYKNQGSTATKLTVGVPLNDPGFGPGLVSGEQFSQYGTMIDVDLPLLTAPAHRLVFLTQDVVIPFTEATDNKLFHPTITNRGETIVTRRINNLETQSNIVLNSTFFSAAATVRLNNVLCGRVMYTATTYGMTGRLLLNIAASSVLSGSGSFLFTVEWNPVWDPYNAASQKFWSGDYQLTESTNYTRLPDVENAYRATIDNNNPATHLFIPIKGKSFRVIVTRISGGTVNSGTLTGAVDLVAQVVPS